MDCPERRPGWVCARNFVMEKRLCAFPKLPGRRDDVPSGAIDGKYCAVFDFVNR